MDRTKLQRLASLRLDDAQALLEKGRWAGAYYLCGYVLECAFKACLLRHLGESSAVFGDRDYVKKLGECWTHNLERLEALAGLKKGFGLAQGADPALARYWTVAKDWDEESRHEEKSEADARLLHEAVSHPTSGVFQWLRSRW